MEKENKKASKVRRDIGGRIGQIREMRGLTQAALASQVGESPRTITHWENATHDLRTESLVKLSNALSVSIDFLLGISPITAIDEMTQRIHKKTGLSESAISTLMAICLSETAQSELQFINDILSDRKAIYFISAAYEEYKQIQQFEKYHVSSQMGDEPYIITSRGSTIDINESKKCSDLALFTCQNRFMNFIQREKE